MAGASTVLTTHRKPLPSVGRLVVDLVGDDTTGLFDTLALVKEFDGRILAITTNPGATAPTDNWDVVLNNSDGFDILGAAGANRDTIVTERAAVTDGFVAGDETVTLVVTGNVVNDALIHIEITYTHTV